MRCENNHNATRQRGKGFWVILFCCVYLCGCGSSDRALVFHKEEEAVMASASTSVTEQEKTSPRIVVHVCGAVVHPGVVEVTSECRVADVLKAAGGLNPEGAPDYVNLAAKVEDGQQLYFPTREEAERLRLAEREAADALININRADTEQLCTLPGIGEARAGDIIEYRKKQGGFQSKEEIMQVTGIKQSTYDRLQDYITVD